MSDWLGWSRLTSIACDDSDGRLLRFERLESRDLLALNPTPVSHDEWPDLLLDLVSDAVVSSDLYEVAAATPGQRLTEPLEVRLKLHSTTDKLQVALDQLDDDVHVDSSDALVGFGGSNIQLIGAANGEIDISRIVVPAGVPLGRIVEMLDELIEDNVDHAAVSRVTVTLEPARQVAADQHALLPPLAHAETTPSSSTAAIALASVQLSSARGRDGAIPTSEDQTAPRQQVDATARDDGSANAVAGRAAAEQRDRELDATSADHVQLAVAHTGQTSDELSPDASSVVSINQLANPRFNLQALEAAFDEVLGQLAQAGDELAKWVEEVPVSAWSKLAASVVVSMAGLRQVHRARQRRLTQVAIDEESQSWNFAPSIGLSKRSAA